MQTQVVCDQCDGTGEVIAEKCPDCKGAGALQTNKQIKIDIPAGVQDGTKLRIKGARAMAYSCVWNDSAGSIHQCLHTFTSIIPIRAGEGDAGQRGGPPGDLYVFLTVEADRQFRREGIDLYSDLNVDYLGASA